MPDSPPPLYTVESIVTPGRDEFGLTRMRFPGKWVYWWQPVGAGGLVTTEVTDPDQVVDRG